MSKTIFTDYKISSDPRLIGKEEEITPELSHLLVKFHKVVKSANPKKSNVRKLLNAIEKYPENPQLKNFLSRLYEKIGDTEKTSETIQWIVSEHPDYLFGKLNLAIEYYDKEEYHKMPEIMGETMELKDLYPTRKAFDINEVISFYRCAVLYFTAIGDIEQAEVRVELMQELAPDSDYTDIASKQIFAARMEAARKQFEEEEKNRISVKTKEQQLSSISASPKFENPEIEWLYTNGLDIDKEKLNTLLSLPRESLISDLELVLQDSIDRYAYFSEEDDWEEEPSDFLIHAVYLLGELESTKSLENIFHVLRQSYEYLHFYFGDFLTAEIWDPVYKLANHNLEACKQFLFEPGVDTFARSVITDMVEQVAHHQPERRSEVIQWFREVIQFFLNSELEDNVIDSDLNGFIICNVLDLKGKELMPEVEKLFDKGIVSLGVCGVWKDVKKDFEQPDRYDKKREILSISEKYDEVTSTWAGYTNDEERDILDTYINQLQQTVIPVRTESKTGRNDPCPCGSGKKYKKCCINKL